MASLGQCLLQQAGDLVLRCLGLFDRNNDPLGDDQGDQTESAASLPTPGLFSQDRGPAGYQRRQRIHDRSE